MLSEFLKVYMSGYCTIFWFSFIINLNKKMWNGTYMEGYSKTRKIIAYILEGGFITVIFAFIIVLINNS